MKNEGDNPKPNPTETPKPPPYLHIPNIERPGNHKSSPNSGPEYNPVLERNSSWFDNLPDGQEIEVFSQQPEGALHGEPGVSSSHSEKE